FGFSSEALDQFFVRQGARAHKLDGHEPIQADLPRFEHDAHPAARDLFEQFVITEVAQFTTDKRTSRCSGLFLRSLQSQAEQALATVSALAVGWNRRAAFTALAAGTHF